ncbi:MAG: PorT family protein [Alistipes sp.]|nr:PorT family protein [Alistipes sp.]
MKIKERYIRLIVGVAMVVVAMLSAEHATAQHTLSITGGTGASYARFYPAEETKWLWGRGNFGLSWRFYSPKPRFVGAVGVDLEYMQKGFMYGYDYESEWLRQENGELKEIRHYKFYTRNVNSLVMPLVWQPHIYAARNHLRIFMEAAVVFSYNISSSYSYEKNRYPAGNYEWKVPRDNRFGYGLSGGLGFALLFGQVEVGFKAKYDFGYSDILKNRNRYYSNDTDGRENPFWYQPLRSPLDNLTFSMTLGWRFNARGFDEWFTVRPKRERSLDTFNFSAQTGGQSGGNKGGAPNRGGTRPGSTRR